MKRLILIILILSGLIGCTAKKYGNFTNNSRYTSTERTDSNAISRTDSAVTDKTKAVITDQSEIETEVNTIRGNYTNSIIYLFDTSQPADKETGLPPVSSIFDTRSGDFLNIEFSERQINNLRLAIDNDIRKEYENKLEVEKSNYHKNIDILNQELKEKEKPVLQWKLLFLGSVITIVIILAFKAKKMFF